MRSLLVPPQLAKATWQRPAAVCQEVVGSTEGPLEVRPWVKCLASQSAEQGLGRVVRKVK